MKHTRFFPTSAALFALLSGTSASHADQPYIVLASTTSVDNSGLLTHILPLFTGASGVSVHVVALGTGQALDTARRGDADLVLVHDPDAEAKFIGEGQGIYAARLRGTISSSLAPPPIRRRSRATAIRSRHPQGDLERGRQCRSFRAAIAAARTRSIAPMEAADLDVTKAGPWYKDIGGGMGADLNAAAALDAYTVTDRGTWLSLGNRRNLVVLLEGDPRLLNRYDVIELNPQLHPQIKRDLAKKFADWLGSPQGQKAIGDYEIAGQKLFHPEADPKP